MVEKPTQTEINAFCQAAGQNRDDALINSMLRRYGDAIIHMTHKPGDYAPLGYAANWGHADLAEFFIARGADVNRPAENGFTPLMSAAWHTGNPETVAILLKNGANVDAATTDGQTARKIAIEQMQVASLRLIDAVITMREAGAQALREASEGTSQPLKPLRRIKLKV